MNILQLKENHLFVSRAATAIYLILRKEKISQKKILYPANICYAAIYPSIYAGNDPIFCDVNSKTGNVTYEIVSKYVDQIAAMVLPHMYGNPIEDIVAIRKLCDQKKVLLIEDCASAMGSYVSEGICGQWGHYSIFSTGYSKTIDLGKGGILLTDKSIDDIKIEYSKLPKWTTKNEENEMFFSKLYRLIRNTPEQTLSQYIWQGFYNNLKELFIYQLPGIDHEIENALENLGDIKRQRKTEVGLYNKFLKQSELFRVYEFSKDAVPWRFSILISEKKEKQKLISYLLKNNIPVSDWYPVVTPIFGIKDEFSGATKMENEIVNFPLLVGEDEIKRICECMNNYISNKN